MEGVRLFLRRFRKSDVEAFAAYRADPQVERYQGWENFTLRDAQIFFEKQQSLHPGIPGQWFQFAIELKNTAAFIGDCAFCIRADDSRQAEFGFTLAPRFQGYGYAAEAVNCLLRYAFETFDLHRITATTDVRNLSSIRLLERTGLRREGRFVENAFYKGEWCDEYLYAILRKEWKPD